MKVIYKNTIVDKINDAIIEAKRINKKIEKFELTKGEFSELTRTFQNINWVANVTGYTELPNGDIKEKIQSGIICGIDFVVIDEDN